MTPRVARRRILDADINVIALCRRGANRQPVIFKSEDDTASFDTVTKFNEERGELTSVVYAPNVVDTQGDYADADTIRKIAHKAMRNGRIGINIDHDGKTLDSSKAAVVESFIIAKGDERFQNWKDNEGQDVDLTGAWATVIKLDDEDLKRRYREGDFNGVSMEGKARLRLEKNDTGLVAQVVKALASVLGIETANESQQTDDDGAPAMTDKDKGYVTKTDFDNTVKGLMESIAGIPAALAKATEEAQHAQAAGVLPTDDAETRTAKITLYKKGLLNNATSTTVAKSGTAPANNANGAGTAKPKPVFKGDLTKKEDVDAFRLEVKKWEIEKDIDHSDPESIAKAAEAIAALNPGGTNQDTSTEEGIAKAAGVLPTDTPEVRAAKITIFKAHKASNTTASGGTQGSGTQQQKTATTTLSKADQEAREIGERMAKAANEARGFGSPATK